MILLHNFSKVFEKQNFYKNVPHTFLNHTKLVGVRGYMEEEAKYFLLEEIRKYIRESKLHFLDSGNYHHLSFLYTSFVREEFVLVVYDHHTDMQPSAFGSILSCGSWIAEVVEKHSFLQKVYLVGVKKEYIETCPYVGHPKVCFVDSIQKTKIFNGTLPVYLSIDKDVLSKDAFLCDWDQGDMTPERLLEELRMLCEHCRILGIDVCGESDDKDLSSISCSNEINLNLLKLFSGFIGRE